MTIYNDLQIIINRKSKPGLYFFMDFELMNFIKNSKIRFTASIIIAIVFVLNIQAGLDFFFHAKKYVAAFELSGVPGQTAVAGTGLLFLMWNVPYAFALWNPIKNRISLLQALLMQLLGCIGETIILFRFSHAHYPLLSSSIKRFILFDSIGLFLLILAAILVWRKDVIQRST